MMGDTVMSTAAAVATPKKVRFGYTMGPEVTAEALGPLVDDLERLGFDSLWVPEAWLTPTLDPIVALTFAAARTTKLKLGSHLIIPGKNPVQLARQTAQLDRLSNGRLLLVGVLGIPEEADTGAQDVERRLRSKVLDEVVPLLRRLWAGETVTHVGERYQLDGVSITPTPVQQPLELWLAGQVPAALRRTGRLGDGWMPGLVFPHEAAAMRTQIEEAAAAAGRSMDAEHYGANLFYANEALPPEIEGRLSARRAKSNDGASADGLVPVGPEALTDRVHEWLDAGFSKFLVRPMVAPADATAELERLAETVLPLTT